MVATGTHQPKPRMGGALRRVPLPLVAGALAGGIVALGIVILPDWRLERLAFELYLDRLHKAYIPPIGLGGRLLLAGAAGALAAALTAGLGWAVARFYNKGDTMGALSFNWRFWEHGKAATTSGADAAMPVRRRDFHPDAPAPRPVLAHNELGAPLPPVLATKGEARPAPEPMKIPDAIGNPDDILDLGAAFAVVEADQMPAPAPVPASAPATMASPEYPTWAYEEGLRMAAEDQAYAAEAVSLARRVHQPTPPEKLDDVLGPVGLPQDGAHSPLAAQLPEPVVPEPVEVPAAASMIDAVQDATPDVVQAEAVPASAVAPVPESTLAPIDAPIDADASIEALVARLERAMARRAAMQAAQAPVPQQPTEAAAATAVMPGDDPALDAALATLARMNRQAYG